MAAFFVRTIVESQAVLQVDGLYDRHRFDQHLDEKSGRRSREEKNLIVDKREVIRLDAFAREFGGGKKRRGGIARNKSYEVGTNEAAYHFRLDACSKDSEDDVAQGIALASTLDKGSDG